MTAKKANRAQATSIRILDVESLLPDQLVPFYLMASFLYYEMDLPALSDAEFDALARRLRREWEHIEHRHKRLIDYNAIGTGFYLSGKYPTRVRCAALAWKESLDRKAGTLREG